MSYKGRDLDLRTPHAPGVSEDAAGQAGWSLPMPGRDGPIPVDQTVLACCNAAYDAALFHGARDVRVEHLLYALTRVDAARDILEQHGVRTQQLRRDAASAIVDEVPATGSKTPRSSTEYENVLRRAAGRAGQDSVPASVHDVMRAVLSYGRFLAERGQAADTSCNLATLRSSFTEGYDCADLRRADIRLREQLS